MHQRHTQTDTDTQPVPWDKPNHSHGQLTNDQHRHAVHELDYVTDYLVYTVSKLEGSVEK